MAAPVAEPKVEALKALEKDSVVIKAAGYYKRDANARNANAVKALKKDNIMIKAASNYKRDTKAAKVLEKNSIVIKATGYY
ncbi:hypothetical protein GE09DRAFT_1211626 [Coniochaeta sp. 2T2.1]|nr:hypothetical protein GE09DRAFT_1211626 [Coniochaeta sp. 2T2.1]